MKSIFRFLALAFVAAPFVSAEPATARLFVNKTADGVALRGYDAVAYFTDHKPVKGDAKFTVPYEGATYRFASAEHRDLFAQSPATYAPAFGGYCGYAASIGKVRPVTPELWSIVGGRLILQHSKGAVELWEKDVPGNAAKADRLWPRLVEAKAGKSDPIDGLLGRSVLPDIR